MDVSGLTLGCVTIGNRWNCVYKRLPVFYGCSVNLLTYKSDTGNNILLANINRS